MLRTLAIAGALLAVALTAWMIFSAMPQGL